MKDTERCFAWRREAPQEGKAETEDSKKLFSKNGNGD